jgi:hypothetical protein
MHRGRHQGQVERERLDMRKLAVVVEGAVRR